jgi:hypothetical protein
MCRPCCGTEPDCVRTVTSPVPCIERDPQYIPNHNVSRTCVCADTYFGEDCGTTIADATIKEALANYKKPEGGCFAQHSSVQIRAAGAAFRRARVSDLRGCASSGTLVWRCVRR